MQTAIVQFSIRTLLRSRQHRLLLAFYLGIGFAITILFLKTPLAQRLSAGTASDAWQEVSMPLLVSSILTLGFWIVGMRVVFSLPLNLPANWIFRVTPIRGGLECLAARRLALYVLGVAPVWTLWAVLFLSIWPWQAAVGHLVVLALLGLILAELCLHGAQKIPFSCSYLPGKSNFHITFWLCIGLLVILVAKGAELEGSALQNPSSYVTMLLLLGIAALLARWRTAAAAQSEERQPQFEEEPLPVILSLGLHRDGTLLIQH